MVAPILITFSSLLIIAFFFDITSSRTKIPSAILLLVLGWAVRETTTAMHIEMPDMSKVLPVLGTIGLILIVLEGSLELRLNKERLPLVSKSAIIAFFPILLFSFGLAYAFDYYTGVGIKNGLANAIPLAVISSAIAIPSAKHLHERDREFVTYESSLSDIFGVIFFNFITLNEHIGAGSFVSFIVELVIMLAITLIATLLLAFLLSKIDHHIKYTPIILMVLLVYSIAKLYHLPALVFILLLGLFLGNLNQLTHLPVIKKLKPEVLEDEVPKFGELTMEIAFLIRATFFILFGYMIKTSELLHGATLEWSIPITTGIFALRFIFLKYFRLPTYPLLFLAPRGLITILLFLSIPLAQKCALANESLIIQVILFSALIMMTGLVTTRKKA